MSRGFWRGIIAGSVLGGLMGNWLGKPAKKINSEQLNQQMGKLRVQAQKVMDEAKDGVKELYQRKR